MGNIDLQKTNSEPGVQEKVKYIHILDVLDNLDAEERSGVAEKLREEFSREIIITLESTLLKLY